MIYGYLRVSTEQQDTDNQKGEILHHYQVDDWVSVECSSRKSQKERGLTKLFDRLQHGDTLVVTELSRLARSTTELILMVQELIRRHVGIVAIKQGLRIPPNGEQMDPAAKLAVTLFGLMAEMERDFISIRTKMGLAARRAAGVRLGKPPGTQQTSILDARLDEIRLLRSAGVSVLGISKHLGCGYATITHYLRTRGL
jgi:DNA invertase Pin-like site-specific DNA recombinase